MDLMSYAEDRHAIIAHWRPLGSNGRPLPDDGVERSYCAVFDGHNGSRSAEVGAYKACLYVGVSSACTSYLMQFGGLLSPMLLLGHAHAHAVMFARHVYS
jgi:hypothetical protein